MASPLPAFQEAVYQRLDANLTETVYDYLPSVDPVTGAAPARPFVAMVGESDVQARLTKTAFTHRLSATLRCESSARGGSEVRALANTVITAFDTALAVTGYTVYDTPEATVSRFADSDEAGELVFVAIIELQFLIAA